jgi:hypothetical protein
MQKLWTMYVPSISAASRTFELTSGVGQTAGIRGTAVQDTLDKSSLNLNVIMTL